MMPTKKAKAEKKTNAEDAIRRERILQVLPCELTRDELAEAAAKMAAAWAEKARFEDDLKSAKTQMASQIAGAEAQINLYAEKVRSKTESRKVECDVVTDYNAKTKSTVRLDTGKILSVRSLTIEELQIGLKLNDKAAPKTEADNQAAIDTLDDGEAN
jgi:hypothetical protein